MSVRIWAGAAAVVLAILLVLVAIGSFEPPARVVPVVAVAPAEGAKAAPAAKTVTSANASAAEAILAERTRLQAEPAVDSGRRVDELIKAGGASLAMKRSVDNADAKVRTWIEETSKDAGKLLQPAQYLDGRATLPYRMSDVLVQPEGRDFRRQHNGEVRYGGGWLIFGVSLALALFLLGRGRIGIAEPWTGDTVERFSAIERANHWMTASAFILMALTGVVILYGKPLLLPWMSASVFSAIALWSAWLHMAAAVPFVIGILVMVVLWIGSNLPTRLDWEWLKRGGGFLRDDGNNPPAERFNAGQKLVFWGVVLGGLGMLATGLALMWPFLVLGYDGMQWMQLAHAGLGLAMIALIIGHIYIGTVGMVGAFDAMWRGVVDRAWAREHHRLWYERLTASQRAPDRAAERRPPAGA